MRKTILSIIACALCMVIIFSAVSCKTNTANTTEPTHSATPIDSTTQAPDETPEAFAISSNELRMFIGESKTLYSNEDEGVKWKSDNSDLAKIDDKGNVYALKKGNCVITAENGNGESRKCSVTVYDAADYMKLPDIGTLSVNKSEIDKSIADEFASMAEYFAEKKEKEEGKLIETGDIAAIAFSGVLEGSTEPFEGGTGTYDLQIGSKSFIDGFEDGLIGHKAGETVVLDLTFPSDYADPTKYPDRAEQFNGKKVTFTVTIDKVYITVPAQITDELISKATQDTFKTVNEYNEYLQLQIKEYLALEKVIASCEISSYPDELVKYYNEIWINNKFGMYAQYYGMTAIQFACQYYGYTEEQLIEEATNNSKGYIEQLYVVFSIIAQDGFVVPEQARDEILKDYAESGGFDSVEELIKEAGDAYIDNYVANEYTIKYIAEQVKTIDDTTGEN